MKPVQVILIAGATALVSGGLGFFFGGVIGRTVWTIGDGIPMGVCLTTEIAKQQKLMTQVEAEKVTNQARSRVQKAANKVVPIAEFNFNCSETIKNFPS